MEKLLRYWNQNKRKILITIAVIALVIIIIQIANAIVKQQNEAERNRQEQNTQIAQDVTKPSESIITDTELTEKEIEDNSTVIEQFVQYCNQKDTEAAYNLLSDDCKEELYTNSNIFESGYINQIFTNPKNYELELWYENGNYYTYRITYNEGNLLQTGGVSSSNNFIDYITVVKQNDEFKLNINNFIRKEAINKQGNSNNINILVNSKSIYVDYEIYNITVTNNTQNTILLSDGQSVSDICLLDRNDNTYNSVISELPISSLTLNAQYRKTINIKFNKIYMTSSQIEYMQIKDIYLNKEQYDANLGQENIETTTIQIQL